METRQDVGRRLKNSVQSRLNQRWKWCDGFYSDMERFAFRKHVTDFDGRVQKAFPDMKTRQLTRTQWGSIRRSLGNRRRSSPTFFQQEREELALKYHNRRLNRRDTLVQLGNMGVPQEELFQLVVGTRVTARLIQSQFGIFSGAVEEVDFANSRYKIAFDQTGLGSQTVADYDVLVDTEAAPRRFSLRTLIQKWKQEKECATTISVPPSLTTQSTVEHDSVNDPPSGFSPEY